MSDFNKPHMLTDIREGDHDLARRQGMIVDEGDGCVTWEDWDFYAGAAHASDRVDWVPRICPVCEAAVDVDHYWLGGCVVDLYVSWSRRQVI